MRFASFGVAVLVIFLSLQLEAQIKQHAPILVQKNSIATKLKIPPAQGVIDEVVTATNSSSFLCKAFLKLDDGSRKELWVSAPSGNEYDTYRTFMTSALCDTLIQAQGTGKRVLVKGSSSGSTISVDAIEYRDALYTGQTPEKCTDVLTPKPGQQGYLEGQGKVIRVRNWINDPEGWKHCSANILINRKVIEANIVKAVDFDNYAEEDKEIIQNSRLKACEALANALSSGKTVYVGGGPDINGMMRLEGIVKILP